MTSKRTGRFDDGARVDDEAGEASEEQLAARLGEASTEVKDEFAEAEGSVYLPDDVRSARAGLAATTSPRSSSSRAH